jgi:hypothetical protein
MRSRWLRTGRIPWISAAGRPCPPPLRHRCCQTAVSSSARGGFDPLKDPGWVRLESALTGRELSRASPMRFQTPPSEALAGPSTYPKTRVTVDQETGRPAPSCSPAYPLYPLAAARRCSAPGAWRSDPNAKSRTAEREPIYPPEPNQPWGDP